ncbi:MAG: MCE family protein [Planctomycetes bacterium]|nr:MCE family protein [Planctomycetota bacterium]
MDSCRRWAVSRNLTAIQAVVLALLVIGTLALAAFGLSILNERSGWTSGSLRVLVGFPDVGGVEVGSRVRVQGIDAGEVEAIMPPDKPGEPVRLQLRIIGKYRHLVRDDAKVQIVSDSLLAGKVVRIVPGSPGGKPIDDYAELRADMRPDPLEDASKALAKATSTIARADAILESIDKGEGTVGKLVKDDAFYKELHEAMAQTKLAIRDARNGEGAIGKVVTEAIASLQDIRRMVALVGQNADAIKSLPLVRSYVVDIAKELIRPDCKRYRTWYADTDLFEPGKSVLTADGRKKLDEAAVWLNKHKYENSEIVIAAFAAPTQPADFANQVTLKQCEATVEYLRSKNVHHTGWWWWSTRPIKGIACGNQPTPVPETEKMPAGRVEILVFVPVK